MNLIHCGVGHALTKGLFNGSDRGDRGTGRIVFGTPPISPALSLRDAARSRPGEARTIAG
ncbi:MAG: hypothetical protein NWQ35_12255 [Verrucomicrobiales bacterium]|nr:hypothetical protein [Verrucomicrobiales bacterium]MDP5006621.1 hypothetical protein [Verrucomicrobiales bacterium]